MSDSAITRVAVFGGSFNPPHLGHLMAASWMLATQPIDELWFLPVWDHAFDKELTPYEHRVAMVEADLATTLSPGRARISHAEKQIGGESRTIDTLRWLQAHHPDHRFALVVGADILAETHKWKNWDGIVSDFGVFVLGRGGYETPDGFPGDVPLPTLSSTELRAALARGDLAACLGRMGLGALRHCLENELYETPLTVAQLDEHLDRL